MGWPGPQEDRRAQRPSQAPTISRAEPEVDAPPAASQPRGVGLLRPQILGGLHPSLRAPTDRFECALALQWQSLEQDDHGPNIAVARNLEARRYLVAERCTLADISLHADACVAGEGGFDLGRYPTVRAWLGRVAAEPGHVTIDA